MPRNTQGTKATKAAACSGPLAQDVVPNDASELGSLHRVALLLRVPQLGQVVDNRLKSRLLDLLVANQPVLTYSGAELGFVVNVLAPSESLAISKTKELVQQALVLAGLPTALPIIRVTVSDSVPSTQLPPYVSVSDIAELLDISRQAANQRTSARSFPAAFATTGTGSIWDTQLVLNHLGLGTATHVDARDI